MILKLIGSILIAISSWLFGVQSSGKLKNRIEDIRDMEQFLEQLENEISFFSNVLSEALHKITKGSDTRISLVLREVSNRLENQTVNEAWKIAVKNNQKNIYLNEEDIEIVLLLGNLLGVSDVSGQVSNIENIKSRLKYQEKKAEAVREKNEILSKNLSVLLGITIIILLI